ncbi:MAG: hypothetical protein K2L77_02815 [Muribaculaceae bacterium]|nr:hypothetical protein [Muribaculaceae bacterium]
MADSRGRQANSNHHIMKRIIMLLMIQPMFVADEAQFHVDADISGMPTTYKTEINKKNLPQKFGFSTH